MRDATWRVGRKVKRTVYIGDELAGLMDTPELADEVIRAVNNRRMVESAARETSARLTARLDSLREDRDAYVRRLARCREVRDQLRAENADLRRLCADEHSREGQAMDSHVKAGVDGTVSVSTDNGKTWSEPESVKVEDGTFTARVQVLKQLVELLETCHTEWSSIWQDSKETALAEARRVLGETPSDPVACTCRPIFGGLDVDEHCPSHGWKS